MSKKKKKRGTRGGCRAGAGRKPMAPEEKMTSISFALPIPLLERIDERQHVEGRGSRSELLRIFSEEGLARKPKQSKKGSVGACRTAQPTK